MDWKKRAKQLKSNLPALFLALHHPQTPWYAKALAAVTVGYALSPIDLIPDFIPLLGYLDDLLLLPLLVLLTIRCIPSDIWEECQGKAQNLWQNGKPKHYKYAIPILLFWCLVLWWLCHRFF